MVASVVIDNILVSLNSDHMTARSSIKIEDLEVEEVLHQ